MTETAPETWLTQDAYDRLQAELEYLSGPGRKDLSQKIEAAREEGDLKENGGYHAAKEEQGKQEARIRQLTQLLRNAKVGQAPETGGAIAPGMIVEAVVGGRDMRFLLGSREVAGDADVDVFSERSPLGVAVLGHRAGDEVSYAAPNGSTVPVRITATAPYVA